MYIGTRALLIVCCKETWGHLCFNYMFFLNLLSFSKCKYGSNKCQTVKKISGLLKVQTSSQKWQQIDDDRDEIEGYMAW